MKNYILVTAFMLVGLGQARSQSFDFGVKAGLNLATITGDLEDTKTKVGIHLGAMAEFPLSDTFSIQPEVLFSSQGARYSQNTDDLIRLNYLNIPVVAKYYLMESLSLEAGPQLGILMKAESDVGGQTDDIKDMVKSTDIGITLGLGYKLSEQLNVGARYFFGGNINDLEGDSDSVKNSVIMLSLGYFF